MFANKSHFFGCIHQSCSLFTHIVSFVQFSVNFWSPKSFDGRGNYALGIKEHIVFPEIDFDKVDEIWGLDVVVCTTARSNNEAKFLLGLFNFPFRD